MYYNSTSLSGEDLKQAVASAKRSQDAIMLIFDNTNCSYSPSVIHSLTTKAGLRYPITSIRRAITDLTNDGKLYHTGLTVPGPLGKPEGVWKINRKLF